MIGRSKPDKPYAEFPLTAHPNGQWSKKFRGRVVYFGPWDDWQSALDLYLKERDDLHAGRRPSRTEGLTLGEAMDRFLSSKKLLELSGELSHRSYLDYERTCDRVGQSISTKRVLSDVRIDDLEKLRADLGNGIRGKLNVTTIKGDLTRARCLFLYINEFCGVTLPYRKPLRSPKQVEFRKLANKRGPRVFDRKEILAMIDKASLDLRAMIYLGINCGFGNSDCGTLPFDKIDLDKGWHRYERPKTHNPRRCPLWPETVTAIKAAIAERPESDLPFVFLTGRGSAGQKLRKRTTRLAQRFGSS